jgi:short-subunit dehydrogenase
MDLLLVSLPGEGLPELGSSIARDAGVRAECLEADLRQASALEGIKDRIESKGLEVELLVNDAGLGGVGPFMGLSLGHHEATVELNVLALMRLTRLVVEERLGKGGLRILNVASLGSFYPMPTLSVYSATKGFVFDFSLALRAELAPEASVSVLCPNAFATTKEVGEYVAGFGLLGRLACLPPERIAREALDGTFRGKAVIVPGAFNKALGLLSHVVPRSLVMKAILHFWGGYGEVEAAKAAKASAL